MARKILAFTGCRSDYDLLSLLYLKLANDPDFDFKLIVCGAHLSEEHGMTVQMIERDRLPILARLPTLSVPLAEDKPYLRVYSAANLFLMAIKPIIEFNPDLIIFAGDREEVIVAATVGTYLGIPCAHFFSGDHGADGHIDHNVRHATTKLSHLHFVSNEEQYKRVVALGEDKRRIFQIGSPALDKYKLEPQLKINEVFKIIGAPFHERFAILIYHPMKENGITTGQCFANILEALAIEGIYTLVSHPNIDKGNEEIIQAINSYKEHKNFFYFHNLGRPEFINLMRNASFIIGNSSAGIVEAPIVPLAAINVGQRQRGRLSTANVIYTDVSVQAICGGIRKATSNRFQAALKTCNSIHGDGQSTERSYQILKSLHYYDFWQKTDDPLAQEYFLKT